MFGICALDLDRRELRRGEVAVPVTPQVFDILQYLIRNRERVVSKDDLIGAIWGGRAITDAALTTRLNAARQAIGDTGGEQFLIKTLTRQGYRFVGEVREDCVTGRANSPVISSGPPGSTAHRAGNPSIAVLPFTTTSVRPDRELQAAAVSEDITIQLTNRRWLVVFAGSTHVESMVTQRGRDPSVRYILEGSVRESDSNLRITSKLIDTATGVMIWGNTYSSRATEICDVRDGIASEVASAVESAIIAVERQRAIRTGSDQLDAWEAYQRGMWHMSNCEADDNTVAQVFFQRAINLDPNDAAGHSALGWSHMMAASIFSELTIAEGCALAEPLVRRAIALDENDSNSHARLAIAALLQGDLEGAFDGAQDALAINPGCAEALGIKGTALLYCGRRQEGREAIQQHLRLSPRDPARPIRLSQVAASLYLDGNYDAAATTARQVIRQYPKHPTAYRWLAATLGQLRRFAEAEAALHRLQTISPSSFEMYVTHRPTYCSIEHEPLLAGLRKAGWKE
jgi:TolB-like protein